MLTKEVFIEYRESGELTNAYSVVLGSEDNTFGVKELATNTVLVNQGTAVDNPSIGRYSTTLSLLENTIYLVSWQVTPNNGDSPNFVVQQIGPFSDDSTIRAVTSTRGVFTQGNLTEVYLRVTEIDGRPRDPSVINATIVDSNSNVAIAGIPEKIDKGAYVFDWMIPGDQAAGNYIVTWAYTVDTEVRVEQQQITISAAGAITPGGPYDPRIMAIRLSLHIMLQAAQHIPVYREQSQTAFNNRVFAFTFQNWNQGSGCRIYRNNILQTAGFTVDYFTGKVIFDQAQLPQDQITATYNFRWFDDEALDRFLSTALARVNYTPHRTGFSLMNVPGNFMQLVLWGAAVEALRRLMLDITFQEPALVFGSPEMQDRAFNRFQQLKENYEKMLETDLAQKKNARYVGLTQTMVTPEYTLPGGRSRWFRYLFGK